MGIIGDIASVADVGVSALNFWEQKKQNTYNKHLQKEIFQREDNAMQRRVADLKAAGLSPVLAAGGSGAGAGTAVSVNAPQMEGKVSDAVIAAMSIYKQKADIDITEAQKELIKEQVDKTKIDQLKGIAEIDGIGSTIRQQDANIRNIDASTYVSNLEAKRRKLDLEIQQKTGTTSNTSGWGGLVKDLSGSIYSLVDDVKVAKEQGNTPDDYKGRSKTQLNDNADKIHKFLDQYKKSLKGGK